MKYGPAELSQIHARLVQGDTAGALASIEAAISAEPRNPQIWHLGGLIRRKSGNCAGAVKAFLQAIKLGVKTAEIFNSLALSYEELGQYSSARKAYGKAVSLDGNYLPAQVNRAKLAFAEGNSSEALHAVETLVRRHPNSALAIKALAEICLDLGEIGKAERLYRKVIENDPSDLSGTIKLGQILRDQGKPQAALNHYGASMGTFANKPEFAEALVGPLVDLQRFDEAHTALNRIVSAVPSYFPAHQALARLAKEYTGEQDCYFSFRALAEKWPKEVSVWNAWASTAAAFRDYDKVITIIDQAQQHISLSTDLNFLRAVALAESGDPNLADATFDRIAAETSDKVDFLVARGRNALRLKDGEKAKHWIERALELQPDNQFAWAYMGLAWRFLQDEQEYWLHDLDKQTAQKPLAMLQDPKTLDELASFLRTLHIASSNAAEQSMRNGTQTQGALFRRQEPILQELKQAIIAAVGEYVEDLPEHSSHPFYRRKSDTVRFTGSWSVRLGHSGFHVSHIHQEGWISSALHVVVPDTEGDAAGPSAGYLELGSAPAELGLEFEPRKLVKPVAGSLVLFPSMLWHGTAPFRSDAERLTVAFDAVPA